jgi:hypothetical protein
VTAAGLGHHDDDDDDDDEKRRPKTGCAHRRLVSQLSNADVINPGRIFTHSSQTAVAAAAQHSTKPNQKTKRADVSILSMMSSSSIKLGITRFLSLSTHTHNSNSRKWKKKKTESILGSYRPIPTPTHTHTQRPLTHTEQRLFLSLFTSGWRQPMLFLHVGHFSPANYISRLHTANSIYDQHTHKHTHS